jgi:hypothetical protein
LLLKHENQNPKYAKAYAGFFYFVARLQHDVFLPVEKLYLMIAVAARKLQLPGDHLHSFKE